MNGIQTFFIVPAGLVRVWLRRYLASDEGKKCPGKYKYHNAMALVGDVASRKDAKGYLEYIDVSVYNDDPRWPAKCDYCDYHFGIDDQFQVFQNELMRRADGTGELMTCEDAQIGAIWDAWWMGKWHHGPDGKALYCKVPGNHDWGIDGRASNCDSPCANCGRPYRDHQDLPCANCGRLQSDHSKQDCPNHFRNPCAGNYKDARPHKCWVRSGPPECLTVGKGGPGESCGAGAGSIMVPGWHGFLRNGVLTPC